MHVPLQVDCILAYAANVLVATLTDQTSSEARPMLDALRADPRAAKQLLVPPCCPAHNPAFALALLMLWCMDPLALLLHLCVQPGEILCKVALYGGQWPGQSRPVCDHCVHGRTLLPPHACHAAMRAFQTHKSRDHVTADLAQQAGSVIGPVQARSAYARVLCAQLLAHLYAKTDAASLATLRRELLRPPYTAVETAAGAVAGVAVVAGAALLALIQPLLQFRAGAVPGAAVVAGA